jgi:hypothetical protein
MYDRWQRVVVLQHKGMNAEALSAQREEYKNHQEIDAQSRMLACACNG